MEDLLSDDESKRKASIQENGTKPDSAAAPSSQSAPKSPPKDPVGDLHSSSPLQLDQADFLLLAAAAGPAGLANENQLELD